MRVHFLDRILDGLGRPLIRQTLLMQMKTLTRTEIGIVVVLRANILHTLISWNSTRLQIRISIRRILFDYQVRPGKVRQSLNGGSLELSPLDWEK